MATDAILKTNSNYIIIASALAVAVTRTAPGRSTRTSGAVTKAGPNGPGAIRSAVTSR